MYSQREIEEAGLDDFRVCLAAVWAHLRLPKPTPVQLDMAWNLQHAPHRFVIEAFRGVGKSWILVAFVLWTLFLDPQKKVMVVSASQELANNFSYFCKQLIDGMPLFQHLAPRGDQRSAGIAFDVGPSLESKDPSVKSVGITGQLTGSRADLIVADDIEIPKNSYTHLLRDRLAELVKEFDSVLKPNGRVVYLGTPQVEDSLYNKLPDRGYTIRIWPAEIPESVEKYQGRLADFVVRRIDSGWKPGTPIDPDRFDQEELDSRRASHGRSSYALQFMLDTSPADIEKHPLKCKDLIITDCDPDVGHVRVAWAADRDRVLETLMCGGLAGDRYYSPVMKSPEMTSWQGTVLAIDPSGKGKDETGYAIVRFLYSKLYLVDVGGFQDGFAESTLKAIAAAAARHRVNHVIVEENFGGGMFAQLLKPHLNRLKAGSIDEEWKGWSSGQKEMRILDTLEPIIQSHKLVVDRRVIEDDLKVQAERPQYSFIQQMTRMARIRGALAHEDRLEAVSMACAYWIEKIDRDEEKAHDRHKADLLDQELRKFHEHALGVSPSANVWHSNSIIGR